MKHIKAILHDWDDTIVNSLDTYITWYEDFASFHKFEYKEKEEIYSLWGNPVGKIIENLWPQIEKGAGHKMVVDFTPPREYLPQLFPGAGTAIKDLHKRQYILGVLSSGIEGKILETYKKRFDPNLSFHQLFEFQNSHIHKPDPRVFDSSLKHLKKIGINPNEVLYVGDHLNDYKAAKNKGLDFIGVTTGLFSKEDFSKQGLKEDQILESFSKIPSFLP